MQTLNSNHTYIMSISDFFKSEISSTRKCVISARKEVYEDYDPHLYIKSGAFPKRIKHPTSIESTRAIPESHE